MANSDWRTEKRQRFGSIKEVKGKIYARIQYVDEVTGQRKEKLRRARDRRHARELLASMQQELKAAGHASLDGDKLNFGEVAEKYKRIHIVPAVYQNGLKVTGKRSVGPTLSCLKPLIANFGKRKIRSIKPSDLEAYKSQRLETPVETQVNERIFDRNSEKYRTVKVIRSRPRKIASVNRELELMRAIFNFAKGEDVIQKSPFENKNKIIATSAEAKRDRVMSHEQEIRLLQLCTGRRAHLKPLIIAAVDTAMRRGELFKLCWKDVNLPLREITIQASNAKTEKTRTVGLTQRAATELSNLWEKSDRKPSTLVFGIVSTVKSAWRSLCSDACIEDLRFHDLRHTATTRLIRSGVPASEVMKITGHTQTSTFLRYLNQTSESVSSSANMLDNYLTLSKSNMFTKYEEDSVN
jgi:integrase